MTKRKLKFWKVPVTEHFDSVVEKAVELNAYVSKAEFIRDAVREKLVNIELKEEMEKLEKEE